MAKNYVGYETLEEWVAAVDMKRLVFAGAFTAPGVPDRKYGLRVDRCEIVCAQPDERGDVHYCLLPIGKYQTLTGAPEFGKPQRERVSKLHDQAWELVQDWLRERGFTVRHGMVAFPRVLQLLEGWADFLRWDKQNERFIRGDETTLPPAALAAAR